MVRLTFHLKFFKGEMLYLFAQRHGSDVSR
jgi:hypothetical protein